MSGKPDLRRATLAARRALPSGRKSEMDAAIVAALVSFVDDRRPASVAAYRPLSAEPGGPELLPALAGRVPSVLLPVLMPTLDLSWEPYGAAVAGPPQDPTAIAGVDLIVVPAVAVDLLGVRLGRGGGSYDRALTRVGPGTPIVALLYDGEVLDAVPAEPHDRRVTGVITPTAGYRPI